MFQRFLEVILPPAILILLIMDLGLFIVSGLDVFIGLEIPYFNHQGSVIAFIYSFLNFIILFILIKRRGLKNSIN